MLSSRDLFEQWNESIKNNTNDQMREKEYILFVGFDRNIECKIGRIHSIINNDPIFLIQFLNSNGLKKEVLVNDQPKFIETNSDFYVEPHQVSTEGPKPIKSIALQIVMHGGEKIDIDLNNKVKEKLKNYYDKNDIDQDIKVPSNIFLNPTGKLGCVYFDETFDNIEEKIRYLYGLRIFFENNSINSFINGFAQSETTRTNRYIPDKKRLTEDFSIYDEHADYVHSLYKTDKSPESYKRTYINEKIYSVQNDNSLKYMGIYVIGTKNYDHPLFDSILKGQFSTPLDSQIHNLLQSFNLMNYQNYLRLSYEYDNITDIRLPPLSSKKIDYGSGEKYTNIYLSNILLMCRLLGFDQVTIVDNSCRFLPIEHLINKPELIRSVSQGEKDAYAAWHAENPELGGKKLFKKKTQMKKRNKRTKKTKKRKSKR
jgi:hypothetical protein